MRTSTTGAVCADAGRGGEPGPSAIDGLRALVRKFAHALCERVEYGCRKFFIAAYAAAGKILFLDQRRAFSGHCEREIFALEFQQQAQSDQALEGGRYQVLAASIGSNAAV